MATPDPAAAASAAAHNDLYLHVRVIIGIVLGMSITRLLSGVARFVQHPGRDKVYPVHLAWAASILVLVIHFWWWEFRLTDVVTWTFPIYVFVVFYASLFYFLCVLLFPDDLRDYAGYEDYFLSRRRWFFAIFALTFVVDFLDTWLKGVDYMARFGPEYYVRAGVFIALSALAMVLRSRLFHLAFVGLGFLYQLCWIFRMYDTL